MTEETPFDKAMDTVGKLYEQKKFLLDFIIQQQKREGELLANVLKAFNKHKENVKRDVEVLKHNLHVKRVRE